jgi:hypothetical protein
MEARTTIAVCYKAGTKDILRIWLTSVWRYTKENVEIVFVTADEAATSEASEVFGGELRGTKVVQVSLDNVASTKVHGAMLDAFLALNTVKTELFLSMDSDCFPVAEGWLGGLEKMMDDGAMIAGILHPWLPPPAGMNHDKIEWRVRSQHCWNNTHVACQMIRMADLKRLITTGINFTTGDDTGLAFTVAAKAWGWKIDGYKVTRCAKPKDGSDPEFNRYVSLIFGDKVYHHGGFTRVTVGGDKPVMGKAYEWVTPELLAHKGAEFLLQSDNSYCFKFDREEEVAAEKMDRLFGAKTMLKR